MPRQRLFLSSAVLAAVLLSLSLAGCSAAAPSTGTGTSGGSGSATGGGSGGGSTTYQSAPCSLISESQAQSLVGYPLSGEKSIPSSTLAECIYAASSSSDATVSFGFNAYPLTVLKSGYSAPYVTVDNLKTFCTPTKNVSGAQFYAATKSGSTFYVAANNCTAATAMAKLALPKIG